MKAKLLLVEDSEPQGQQIRDALVTLGHEVSWVTTGAEGLKSALSDPPNLILLDIGLKDVDGFSVCRWLRMDAKTRLTPVIILTARGELKDRVQGLTLGANDYLLKPVDPEELEARITVGLRAHQRYAELMQRNHDLETMLLDVERLAVTDELTNLANRRRFEDVLKRELAASRRYGHSLCCVLVDIDRFKQINDTHGHAVGDRVLKDIAAHLAAALREVDLVARYGGEEFAILLPHTSLEGGLVAVKRLAQIVRELEIGIAGSTLTVTASFGIACTDQVRAEDAIELTKAADVALYRAKQSGRDRINIFYRATDSPLGAG